MSTRIKKVLGLLLTGALTISVIGCGSNNSNSENAVADSQKTEESEAIGDSQASVEEELYYNKEGFPIVKEPITITSSGLRETTRDYNSTHVFQKIESDMGIKIEHTGWEDASVASTRFATMITSDTLSDLLFGYSMISKATANQYGEDGYLLDLADYLDVMPNFAKFLEENPEFAAFNTTEDGSIYSIDRARVMGEPKYGMYVSKADQEKYGFSVEDIKTVDDFYEVLKSIKEQNPEVIPFGWAAAGVGVRSLSVLTTAFGIDGENTQVNVKGVDDDGNVILHDITDANKEYFKYMNKLWEEELVDQEAYVLTREEFEGNVRGGKYVFWYHWAELQSGLSYPDGSCYQDYDKLVALTSDYNEIPSFISTDPFNNAARCMVSAKTEYPEAICRLLDYMFTDEGFMFFNYGTEGETYEMVDNGMGDMVVSHKNFWDQENYESESEWLQQAVSPVNYLKIILDYSTLKAVREASDEKLERYISEDPTYTLTMPAHFEKYIRAQVDEMRPKSWQSIPLSDEENKLISQPETDMGTLLNQYSAQFISGDLDVEAEWDNYVKQISLFWDQLQPIYQEAYDRIHKN